MYFDEIVAQSSTYMQHIITPVAPYFICQHFISEEIHSHSNKYIGCTIHTDANDLLLHNNYDTIQNGDIVQVQVDKFDYFCDTVLPQLNKQIILITSQWHLPQLHRNDKTDAILHNPLILVWVSQNPIYPNSAKYMAFPYGICHLNVQEYMEFVRNNVLHKKTNVIYNGHASVHGHLPPNHIRRQVELFGTHSGPPLPYDDYLKHIAQSQFAISTAGDRDDCYRHYECIGLNTVPISDTHYNDIFGSNMIYSNARDMVHMVKTDTVQQQQPAAAVNRDIITIQYWLNAITNHRPGGES